MSTPSSRLSNGSDSSTHAAAVPDDYSATGSSHGLEKSDEDPSVESSRTDDRSPLDYVPTPQQPGQYASAARPLERLGSVPSPEELYGPRRPITSTTGVPDWDFGLSDCTPQPVGPTQTVTDTVNEKRERKQGRGSGTRRDASRRSRKKCHTPPGKSGRQPSTGSTTPLEDPQILRRMRNQEREFDARVEEINETLHHAGHQLVVRDDIIEALRAEIERLRQELRHSSGATTDQTREVQSRGADTHRKPQAPPAAYHDNQQLIVTENTALKGQLSTSEAARAKLQATLDELVRQLQASDQAAHARGQQHQTQLAQARHDSDEKLSQVEKQLRQVERRYAVAQEKQDALQRDNSRLQENIRQMQASLSRQAAGDRGALRSAHREKEALEDEIGAVRWGMARLLHLLSAVPAMAHYLQYNEVSGEFVFAGYPTRYFGTGGGKHGGRRGTPPPHAAGLAPSHLVGSDDHDASAGAFSIEEYMDSLPRDGETGVADGIYGGRTAYADSKNIWLNGQWLQQLQDILHTQNLYMKLKKIKLHELDEAAQLSEQLPNAKDVLACRRSDKDYWIPYAAFSAAQRFKNKYCPRIPALSHFYPFLVSMNRVWNAKMQDRLAVLRKDLQQQKQAAQQKQSRSLSLDLSPQESRRGRSAASRSPQHTPRRQHAVTRCGSPPPPLRVLLLGAARDMDRLMTEHQRLRREVRLHISSQRIRQLFGTYDDLVRVALQSLGRLRKACEDAGGEANSVRHTRSPNHQKHQPRAGPRQPRTQRRAWEDEVSRWSMSEDEEDLSYDPRGLDSVEPLPPAPQHVSTAEQSPPARVGHQEECIERLLCIVQHTCERVCNVSEQLHTRTQAACEDAEQLMDLLETPQQKQPPGMGIASVSTMRSAQQEVQKVLRATYGGDERTSSVAAHPANVSSGEALSSVAASVRDFARLMQREVRQAQEALRTITADAMMEADGV